jgi:hypothetical protein
VFEGFIFAEGDVDLVVADLCCLLLQELTEGSTGDVGFGNHRERVERR